MVNYFILINKTLDPHAASYVIVKNEGGDNYETDSKRDSKINKYQCAHTPLL